MNALASQTEAFTAFSRRWLEWFTEPPEMPLVCEIAADYVAAVRHRRGEVEAWASRPLPVGAVTPGPRADNVADSETVRGALEEVLGGVKGNLRQCVLVVPDLLARVVLLELEQLPSRQSEAEELLRWRLDKDMSFDLRQAQLSFQAYPGRDAGKEVLVTVCLRNLLAQYEEIARAVNLEPAWVTLSSLAALGWLEESDPAPRLLVKRDPASLSVTIVQKGAIRLFRSMPLAPPSAGLAASNGEGQKDERLFEMILPELVYFEDHWGEPVRDVRLCGIGAESEGLQRRLREKAGCETEEFDLKGLDLPPSVISGDELDTKLLPCLGWARVHTP